MKKKKSCKQKNKKLPGISAEERAAKLQATLDYLENELEENVDYLERELPRKWFSKEKLKKREEEAKPAKEIKKIISKKELNKLQKAAEHFDKKLAGNIDYIKQELPKKWAAKAKPKEKKEIKAKEKPFQEVISKEKIDKLQKSLDYLEKELKGNIVYLEKELPKKWVVKEKPKIEEEEKPAKEIKKIISKKELNKLQKAAEHFDKKLAVNVEYIKKGHPKKLLISPSKLNKLIEERKRILNEIITTRNLLASLERDRIRLETEAVKRKAEEHTVQLQKFEHAIGEELSHNINRFKAKKKKPAIKRRMKKKIPITGPKAEVSEQALAELQASLDRLNQELEQME
jgi:hypothetical protein